VFDDLLLGSDGRRSAVEERLRLWLIPVSQGHEQQSALWSSGVRHDDRVTDQSGVARA
jgi:hypothetical protein